MSQHWDEFAKSLAEPVPRRESLRRLGIALTATVLGPLGSEFAQAGRHQQDPCKAFCKCRNKKQQNACLEACKACNKDTSRLCGSCGTYVCCGSGQACCGGACADLGEDVHNCGACGNECDPPGPYEYGACIIGYCDYWCVAGAVYCDDRCTFLDSDPNNCGGCGNACGEAAPYCNWGVCDVCPAGATNCDGVCTDPASDPFHCGACGVACAADEFCFDGVCQQASEDPCTPDNPYYPNCCPGGTQICFGVCTNVAFDPQNCGDCGVVCAAGETCSGGVCQSPW
jgi:hypothetical protein